ncbi:hypothetical protein MPH_05735 [Macrophomina phaseolina MS6]|uniref:Uncharacterized protein n=2 Tax=Macrophomina phaseolina TaxID=35725 RepID=K2SJT5_MACPH|nr:hypothetical protein MPH_05735 [Macrophomina phaseolina MS6]KAH7049253.1 hypothetical protein B0J12DRAFT_664614 [Macrophomina phaseolina]
MSYFSACSSISCFLILRIAGDCNITAATLLNHSRLAQTNTLPWGARASWVVYSRILHYTHSCHGSYLLTTKTSSSFTTYHERLLPRMYKLDTYTPRGEHNRRGCDDERRRDGRNFFFLQTKRWKGDGQYSLLMWWIFLVSFSSSVTYLLLLLFGPCWLWTGQERYLVV